MPVVTTITVDRYNWTRRGHEPLGYCEDQGSYQLLVKRWKWRGITIWKRVLDREDVPMWALIDAACLGGTTWVSKFKAYY